MKFEEYKDYRFIDETDHTHYEYEIHIRIPTEDENNPYLRWRIGVLNDKIVQKEQYVRDIAQEYISKYSLQTSKYEVSLIQYEHKEDV